MNDAPVAACATAMPSTANTAIAAIAATFENTMILRSLPIGLAFDSDLLNFHLGLGIRGVQRAGTAPAAPREGPRIRNDAPAHTGSSHSTR